MLKRYTITDMSGSVRTIVATGIIEAIDKSGVLMPVSVKREPLEHCGGDCGDCAGCIMQDQAV